MPLISVVIATFNRCDVLMVTLDKLRKQTVPSKDFEVLVVDDGSTDLTPEMVNRIIPSLPYSLRFFRHENRGPGFTQNRGIKEASSNIVLLIADDIWATSDLLVQHLETHLEYPEEYYAVLGTVKQSTELPDTVLLRNWDPFGFDRFKDKKFLESIFFYACNISVKKDFLIKNGMFLEKKGAAHEDVELGYRLGKKGLKIIYNERAQAYHFHHETFINACKRAYERGINFNILTETIEKSYILPVYKIFSFEAGIPTAIKMLPHEVLRQCLFNKLLVNYFWIPLLSRAESNFFASLFATNITYRGTIFYHLRKGIKDSKKNFNNNYS